MRDCRWVDRHLDELAQDHPNQWVAVHKGKLVAAGPDMGEVAAQARRKTSASDIVFQFIDDGSMIYVMSATM
jgi:hypothetical protein